MTIHLGTDIVYIPRIQAALDRFGERFLQRVFTQAEQRDCFDRNDRVNRSSTSLAGRWAAKEAIVKALGTGWRGVRYTDVEIQRQSTGAPMVHFYGTAADLVARWGDCQWQLSISHDGDYCVAVAIASHSCS